ncbi:DUF3817 domain-containing protein [Nonomuraea sp. NPDC049152]|uniref:DUF3817 domain-containing protein n=1 Tax=Nonomuraea sp. NPDC049152 TaxID=3154350 RepID=UPI0034024844
MRTLRIAAGIEALSLVVLLVNLLTVHARAVASLVGPLHGTAYLAVIVTTLLSPAAAASGVRWRAAIPAIGGLLALRHIRHRSSASQPPVPNPLGK